MRKFGGWGMVATLTMGLTAAAAVAADPDAGDGDAKPAASASSSTPSPFGKWFSPRKAQDREPSSKADQPSTKPANVGAGLSRRASQVDQAAADQAREQAVLFRRLAVCNKLMEIAVQTNDDDLMRRAEELDERAWTAYGQRTGYLHGNGGNSAIDGETLSKNFGPPGKTGGTGAGLREVNP